MTRISGHETGWGTTRLGDMAFKLTGMSLKLAGLAHKQALNSPKIIWYGLDTD